MIARISILMRDAGEHIYLMKSLFRLMLHRLAPPSLVCDPLDQPEFHQMTRRELDDLPMPRLPPSTNCHKARPCR